MWAKLWKTASLNESESAKIPDGMREGAVLGSEVGMKEGNWTGQKLKQGNWTSTRIEIYVQKLKINTNCIS